MFHRKETSKTETTSGHNFASNTISPNCETSLLENPNSKVETPEQPPQSKRSFPFRRYSWDPMSPKSNEYDSNEQKFFGISFKVISNKQN